MPRTVKMSRMILGEANAPVSRIFLTCRLRSQSTAFPLTHRTGSMTRAAHGKLWSPAWMLGRQS